MDAQMFLRTAGNGAFLLGGFFIGLAFSDQNGSIAWLREWQTLVAGVLAVFAAMLTVSAMQSVDRRQQIRHEELLKLNLRGDRLRIRRAASHSAWLAGWRYRLAEMSPDRLKGIELARTPEEKEFVRLMSRLIGELGRFPHITEIAEAKDLFEPPVAMRYAKLVARTSDATGLANRLANSLIANDAFVLNETTVAAASEDSFKFLQAMDREIDAFVRDLHEILDTYR